jgi:hypothetical protein
MLQGIEFEIALTSSLNFFVDFPKQLLEQCHIKKGHKKASHSQYPKICT